MITHKLVWKMASESEKKVEEPVSEKEDAEMPNRVSKNTQPEKPVRKYRRRKSAKQDEDEEDEEDEDREYERVVVKERNNDNDGLIILSIIGIIAMVVFFLFRLGVVKVPVRQVAEQDYPEVESPLETSSGAHPVFISRDG